MRRFSNEQATFSPGQQSTVFPTAPVGLVYPGDAGISPGLYPIPKGNLQPRLGFAWSPGAGAGHPSGVGLFSSAPFMDKMGQVMPTNLSCWSRMRILLREDGLIHMETFRAANPWPYTYDPATASFVYPVAIQGIQTRLSGPRIAQWNLSVQRAFGPDWLFDVSYVGSAGRHLLQGYEANPAAYIPGNDAFGQSTFDRGKHRKPPNHFSGHSQHCYAGSLHGQK